MAEVKREGLRRLEGEGQFGGFLLGIARPLGDRHAAVGPVEGGGDELRHVERVVGVVVNIGAVLAVVLHAGADTAGEPLGILEGLVAAHFQGEVVHDPSVGGVLRGKDLIDESPLEVVGYLRPGLPEEEVAGFG